MNDLLQSMFDHGHISAEDLIAVRSRCAEDFSSSVRTLRELKLAEPENIQRCLHQYLHFQVATGPEIEALDVRLGEVVPADVALNLHVFCMGGYKNRLMIAMEDPTDMATRRKLEFFLERKIVPIAATHEQIQGALAKLYQVKPAAPTQAAVSTEAQVTRETPPQLDDDFDLVTQKIATSNENQAAAQASPAAIETLSALKTEDDLFGAFADEEPVAAPAAAEASAIIEDFDVPLANDTLSVADDLPADEVSSPAVVADAPTSLLGNREITSRLGAAFVKIGFAKNQESAIAALNEKLADLSIQVSALTDNRFTVQIGDAAQEIDLNESEHSAETSVFVPILKSISRMAKIS